MSAESLSVDRWRSAWNELGVQASDSLFHELSACYSQPHRHYHTLQHLQECFAHFDQVRASAQVPAEIEIALWFHDAIYDTRSKDNEERSAQWAQTAAMEAGATDSTASRLAALVMMTKHDARPADHDARLLVDVDLAILGADRVRFDQYEEQVRREYSWVPGILYRRERRRVLQQFADRPQIYSTGHFLATLEGPARANLARSIARL